MDPFRQRARERGTAFLEGEIEIDHRAAEEQITNRTADEMRPEVLFCGHFFDQIEGAALRSGESIQADQFLLSDLRSPSS
jgi:hypothetical protein